MMGQYQQWLHYRAVDQQLHAQQKQLAKELTDLHEQADLLKESASAADNVIVQALVRLSREFAQASASSTPLSERVKSAGAVSVTGPVDQQSLRTNHVVQRWIERWGRRSGPVEAHVDIQTVFALLDPQDVEQFYQSYHYWQLQQRIKHVQTQIGTVQQQTSENSERMEQVAPGALALATLARLQASGVNDVDLLDRMLERGEAWLDHAMRLLEECEDLKVFDGDYTRWCELALEGAYDWITSMIEATSLPPPPVSSLPALSSEQVTEEVLLQRLMSDDESELFPLAADAMSGSIAVPTEETAEAEEVEVSSTEEEAAHSAVVIPAEEETARAAVEEPAPAEASGEQELDGAHVDLQAPPSVDEVLPQEQEVRIPQTPRPAMLETEAQEPETEEELVSIPQAVNDDSTEEGIHAVEEIMYFTDEIPWQWEEPDSSELHLPALPESKEKPRRQDVQSVKPGFFHRLFTRKK